MLSVHYLRVGLGTSLAEKKALQGVSDGDEEEEGDAEPSENGEGEQDFEEYNVRTFSAKTAELLSKGWTAFVVGVALPA